ncbi:MAG: hypothetical protein GXP42_04900 [Chloroflexi bacterium]|nr:hypothetical protein [Chloroflexota bacterium]
MNRTNNVLLQQILIALVVAVAVFTVGLLAITFALRANAGRTPPPTPTVDLASLPFTPIFTPTPAPRPTFTPTATSTLAATPSATATATPTPTVSPTPTPTVEPSPSPTPRPTPYAGPLRQNGGDYTIVRREGIVVNADLSDWRDVAPLLVASVQQGADNVTGPEDLAAFIRMAWDDAFLYYVAEVGDDVHVQALRSYQIFNGDSVELWLDTDLAGDFNDVGLNADDYQFGFSAGDFISSPAEAVVWYPRRSPQWNALIQIAAQPVGQGYIIEAAIPWSLLGLQPVAGMVMGFAVGVNDNDVPATAAQQTILVSPPTMFWGRPTTFANLRFE